MDVCCESSMHMHGGIHACDWYCVHETGTCMHEAHACPCMCGRFGHTRPMHACGALYISKTGPCARLSGFLFWSVLLPCLSFMHACLRQSCSMEWSIESQHVYKACKWKGCNCMLFTTRFVDTSSHKTSGYAVGHLAGIGMPCVQPTELCFYLP